MVKNPPAMQETQEMQVQSLGREDPLEEGMATHSSILTWRVPWTEEPGGLQSMGSQSRVRLKRLSMHSPSNTITIEIRFQHMYLQFSSVTQSCPTLCNPMNRSMPGLPVHHQLPDLLKLMPIESVMPSSHLIPSSPSPPAPNPSQHQGLFQ